MSQDHITLESDIVERLKSDFSADQFSAALQLLTDCGSASRVQRCIVVAADGSLDALQQSIQLAETDYRDAIVAGEYDVSMQQIRDLRVSFLFDSPLDFWIGELAVFLHSRGFQASWLESENATAGPFESASDRGEGVATFQSGDRTLTIRKQDRRWQVVGNVTELQAFRLHIAYDDEEQFRNQLARMLSENCNGNDAT